MEQEHPKWFKLLTPQTIIYLSGAIVATVVFWIRTQDSWAKIKELEGTISKQWEIQRERYDRTDKNVDILRDWMNYEKGYKQALKDKQ